MDQICYQRTDAMIDRDRAADTAVEMGTAVAC